MPSVVIVRGDRLQMVDFPTSKKLLASAAKFLIEGGDEDPASVLLSCSLECEVIEPDPYNDSVSTRVDIYLIGPRVAYDALSDNRSVIHKKVWSAISAVLPFHHYIYDFDVRAETVQLGPDWHAELLELARGKSVDNQAAGAESFRLYNNLRFRSASEVKIAEALDKAGVMYLPLCKARLNSGRNRVNREPDFLVCHGGKWGILEVDGEPWHPPTRTVEDHTRDRLFRSHGVVVVEHFDAKHCYDFPDAVVRKFLTILQNA